MTVAILPPARAVYRRSDDLFVLLKMSADTKSPSKSHKKVAGITWKVNELKTVIFNIKNQYGRPLIIPPRTNHPKTLLHPVKDPLHVNDSAYKILVT